MWNMSFFGARLFACWPHRGEGATCGPAYNRGRALSAAPRLYSSPPDGLLTLGKSEHDAAAPLIIAPDPFASDDCLDDSSPDETLLLTTTVELDTMNTGEAEPSSGLNARLRPRKSNASSPKTVKTTITKPAADKPKRTSTPSKASPNKPDDLTDKADSPAVQTLCPYCDKTFPAKRALGKHVRRAHFPPSRPDCALSCLFCNHAAADAPDVIRHMVDNHPNQYFACYDCHTRFPSTTELAEHKLNVCEKQKLPYRNKLRQKAPPKKSQKKTNINGEDNFENDAKDFPEDHGFNGIVISCELKSSQPPDLADIEENITTNFILPPGKSIVNGTVIEKNTVIFLDELQWSKRIPPNFTFQNTDADQILSRLGVVHRSPRTGESHGKEWLKNTDEVHQKFEKCFDTKFYSKVASNVQENLTKFLDGSCNFNPDPENTIKTRKTKNIVAINTVEGFPILLASEQFLRHGFDAYMPRAIAPKHKWKWDNLENDKSLMSAEQIKRDSHTNNCIVSLVSSLDIWTQLCMRRKYDTKFNKAQVQKKTEKQSIIGKELKEILESRELPASSSQVIKFTAPAVPPSRSTAEFPASLGLMPTAPTFDLKPAVLSGEWVRPRCYVCCACGAQIGDGKGLSMHIASQHPNAQIQHYEIVGDVLLNSDILKHLYVPPSQMYNRSRPLRGFRECTKCNKSISPEDLHQHMLDCAGDTPTVRNSRKCRQRPFGVRKRRARLPDNTIRKKIRKEVRTRHNRKGHMRPRSRPRTEVGDAETIRKMLADLPAKRHRVMVKPLNPTIRPRRNLRKPRNNMVMRKKMTEDAQNSQRQNPSQIETPSVSAEGKGPDERPPRRPFKRNVKLVASKLLRKKDSFNQKSVNKSKRQIPHQKFSKGNMPPIGETPSPESANDNNIQVDQLSIQNNANRINLNDGSGNVREHGDRSNNNNNRDHANNYNRDNENNYNRHNENNYNRDNENPGGNGDENNGARDDPLAPAPNAPLKHSIASLTASSETRDKAVQFHQMFLIQQECNNLNQHVAAEQRMLFENEAVVTKLDKPPLHFNPRRPVDLQVIQKIKPLKPKKRLNDCIAMLKNKLDPEPSPPTLPGHVSVQCGNDEPLDAEPTAKEPTLVKPSTVESSAVDSGAVEPSGVEPSALEPNAVLLSAVEPSAVEPNAVQPRVTQLSAVEPAVVERRHSTTEVYTEYGQSSAHMLPPAPKNPAQDNAKSVTSKTRSRRSSSTRSARGSRTDKTADILTSQEMLQWKQLYYDSQMLNAQSFTENYTKRESSRRRNSLVPRENLLLQHAMNLNLLSQSNELSKLSEYHYPSASTHHQLTRKNSRRDTQKSKANVQPPRSRAKDNSTPRGKNVTKLGSAPTKPSQWSNKSVINNAPTKANNNRQNGKSTRSRNTATTIEKIVDPYPQAQFSEDTSASLNIEKIVSSTSRTPEEHHSQNFSRNTPLVEYTSDIPPTLYPMSVEAPSAPLDLTNKISNQEGSVQYITQEQYPAAECEIYEPLDSLNQNMASLPLDANTQISNEQEVVDLRINTIANRASFESRYTSMPTELVTDEIDEENATDLCFRSREDFPTDLSMNRLNYSTSTNSYENPSESHNHLQTNYIRDYSTPIMHNGRCIVVHECYDENSQRIVVVENEVPTDWSGRRSATRSNMREIEEPMIMNVYTNNAEPDDENVPTDLTRRNMPSVRSTGVINNSSCSYDSYDSQRAPHYANTGKIINYHYDRPLRTPPESNFTSSSNRTATSYCELSDQFEPNSNEFTATRGLSINDTTLNKSTNYAQIDYSHSEMPLSLVSNSVIESTRNSSCTKSNTSEYEITTTDYTLSNEYMSVEKPEPRYSSTTVTTIGNTNLGVKTKDAQTETIAHEHSPKISEKHNTSSSNKIKTTESKTSSVYNITTTEPTVKTDKEKIEPNKTECLEQDDETARKIAMLPKELVEILGTMPVDHRNQLLKVLPQYVSTSTSPLSHSNSAESVKCKSVTASENLQTTTKPVNQDEDFLFESNSEDARAYKNLQFTESSTISVSSSILLTPPTPKLSERYSLQSSENYDTQTYTRKSRASTEEQTIAETKVDSNKLCVAPVLSSGEEIKSTTEFNNPDRIIDLTVDENSSENTDVTNMETVIQKHVVTATTSDVAETTVLAKSIVQKTSNDKTASLRAVRIKTPSKRHHSLLPENTVINTQNINSLSINVQDDICKVQDDISKDSHNISPKAIQQAMVSSSEHCSDRRTSQTPIISPVEKKQRSSEEKLIVQKDREDETSTEADKLNLVTSTIVKDMNSNLNKACSTDVSQSNITENPVAAVNVNLSPSKKPDGNTDVNDETETNNDELTKETLAIEKQAVFDTLYKESSSMKSEDSKFSTYNVTTEKQDTLKEPSLIEDEDSEDDISLALILKQKQRDFNSVTDAPKNMEFAVNKKKRKTKKQNKTAEVTGSNKKLETSKIKDKNTIIEISNDRVCNESNLMDKGAFGNKNVKKSRRLHHAQNIHYSESTNQANKTNDYENEINKENNVSADKTKKLESPEDSFKVKHDDQDPDRSCSVNTVVNTDKNKETSNSLADNDKSMKMLESCESSDDISEISVNDTEKGPVTQNQIQSNLPYNSVTPSCDDNLVPQPHSCSKIEKILSSEDVSNMSNDITNSKDQNLKLCDISETSKDVDEKNLTKSKKDSAELCSATNVNFDSEDTNVTPLRRSRRGKSLFIASNSTVDLNPVSQESEQKAPLTKKQLIFSKLLQDEENHNKTSLNATLVLVEENLHTPHIITSADYIEDQKRRNTREKSVDTYLKFDEETPKKQSSTSILKEEDVSSRDTPNSEENQQQQINTKPPPEKINVNKEPLSTETLKTSRRKISSQPKTKSKKKKSFEYHANTKDIDMSLQQNKYTDNKEIQNKIETKESVLHHESTHTIPSKIECNTKVVDVHVNEEPECINTLTDVDFADINSKPMPTGKRKSCSPPRQDSTHSIKPKKCKLHDESESTASTSKDIAKRRNTCYNKPARRARSKSVVVKSSSAEWYDPYDIDLEDMIDKTEPFVRKKISAKMSFSSFKSSIAAKTQEWSNTAPSDVINIPPSEANISNSGDDIKDSENIKGGAGIKDGENVKGGPDTCEVACASENKVDRNVNDLFNIKDDISDSDDSTKSDVPLKKYAEEKEKKLAEKKVQKSIDSTNESNEKLRDKTKARKKNNRTVATSKKEEKVTIDEIDSENDLDSDQFMENFGFYYKKKPRKSNLLATKKISETFHNIGNDSDDVYSTAKERSCKKGSADNKKDDTRNLKGSSSSPTKKAASRSRKKKSTTPTEPPFCHVCKITFRRSDNLLRHQLSLYHVSRLCESELKVQSVIVKEEPNYLIAYKQQLDKLKLLQYKINRRKNSGLSTSDIVVPTLKEILQEAKRTIREQELSRRERELSRDEALFLDCCEMLKKSHRKDISRDNKCIRQYNSFNCPQTSEDQSEMLEKSIPDDDSEIKREEEMDSITAKNIMDSEEVRNLENDLISNLKETSSFAGLRLQSTDELTEIVSETPASSSNYVKDVKFHTTEDSVPAKPQRHPEVKDKMYPDINETIDMFEDKFDKIKRKCRSQAAAAKLVQTHVDTNLSYKNRKKSDKKKGKKSFKTGLNAVPTKGALKGFDGIKVSILTSDINMSAIVPSVGNSFKKKRKNNSKKKRERKSSDVSGKSGSVHVTKESAKKEVDIYEFRDTEDIKPSELRPTKEKERYKSINNKEMPSTSKTDAVELAHASGDSASDGDDFVYMDEFIVSEEETENSLISCETGKGGSETKKSSLFKRKDVIEKNAVMGKIFKHNAVRSDKKNTKTLAEPEADFDLLFDSLLDHVPVKQSKIEDTPKEQSITYLSPTPSSSRERDDLPPVVLTRKPEPSMSVTPVEELISQRNAAAAAANKYESSKEYCPTAQAAKCDDDKSQHRNSSTPCRDEDYVDTKHKSKEKLHAKMSSSTKRNSDDHREPTAHRAESPEEPPLEEGGVARQRARRKCAVGKQNVLAETWSSESEPDAVPPRPNSAESAVAAPARRRRPKKREVREASVRRATHRPVARTRPPPLYWSEGEDEPGHPQQHGWIVGDSHKKLVTMLAHAKGRKRSHDDRRPQLD